MVKREAVTRLPGVRLHTSSRALQGVSGQSTPAVAEVDLAFTIHLKLSVTHQTCVVESLHFPGDILMGMDLLHRFSVRMVLEGLSAKNYVELDGCRHRISFTRGGTTGYDVPACHDVADETLEAVETPELSQSPSPVDVSPVHIAEETVAEARSDKHLAIVETCTDRLTVPRTLVTVQGHHSSVWVVDPHLKPRKVRPGTLLGYASFLEPEEVVCTVPASSMTSDTPDSKPPTEHLMDTATPDLEQEEFSEEEEFLYYGEFQDDNYHSTACLDFGYEDKDFFVFSDTPALDEACQHEELEAACAAVDSGTGGTEAVCAPLPIALRHLTANQEGQLHEVQDRFPTLFSGDKLTPLVEVFSRRTKSTRLSLSLSLCLRHAHCPPTAIHPGVHRTFQNLQGAWYFPNMHHLAREYLARCHACQQCKGVAGRAPMEEHLLPEAPLVRVSAYFMDLRGSATRFRYVLSIVDHHTRFMQLVLLRDKSANRVLRAFVDHYVTHYAT
ncbi:Transposon Ty3-I Gag-Pol polyprotein [Penaeus vannamei]|uniref:RNA-directed DNA polymerase n=1 Tax=Penaeus vannamei TaxID=6689 RepID=A0A3R7PW89_PENVA|nr:Transposon Ty3-I Gag-Pol polyprotein [Penaeus vannamei]